MALPIAPVVAQSSWDDEQRAYWTARLRRQRVQAVAHRFDADELGTYKGLPRPTLCGEYIVKREGVDIPHQDGTFRMCTACDTVQAHRVDVELPAAVAEHAAKCGCDKAPRLITPSVG